MQAATGNKVKINYNIGTLWGKTILKMAISLVFAMLMLFLIFFVFGTMLIFESFLLSLIVNLAFLALCMFFFYNMGAGLGEKHAGLSEIVFKRKLNGEQIADAQLDQCFRKPKGFLAVGLAVLPFVIVALLFALQTQKQYYQLGALPGWLNSYRDQTQIGIALDYYYQDVQISSLNVLRLIVRAMNMPFVAIATNLGADVMLWVERLSPLLLCLIPSCYGLGYLRGEKQRIQVNKAIAINAKRKTILDKQRKKRKPEEKKQLI